MSKIILVEGPDCSGKTTICNSIVDNFNFKCLHLSKLKDNQSVDEFYINFIDNLKIQKQNNMNIVLDRAYISNIIYSTVFKQDETISRYLMDELKKLIDIIILCIPDKDKYITHFNNIKNQRFELYDNMNDIYDLYYDLYYNSSSKLKYTIDNCNVILFNMYNIKDMESFIKEIVNND